MGDLIQMDIPVVLQWIGVIAATVAALKIIAGTPVRWTRGRVQEQFDTYIDERIDEKLAPIISKQEHIALDVGSILEKLSPNHGTSVADDVTHTKAAVEEIKRAVLPEE